MRVLILGGTAEAARLAGTLASMPDHDVVSSLAGRTRAPRGLPGRVRSGGFGGIEGLRRYLRDEEIARVIDATHPFAARINANAEAACRAERTPRLRLLRPGWPRLPDDRWHEVENLAAAARLLPRLGRRAFLTVGRQDLAAFTGLDDIRFLIRSVEPPADPPLENATVIAGRGPFGVAHELALLRAHGIDVLVTKASGGDATYAKLEAARELSLPVIMVQRPPPVPGPTVATVDEALAWLAQPWPRHAGKTRGRST